MKHKIQSCLTSIILSFCLGFGTVGSMVSGLELDADLWILALGCIIISVVVSLLLTIPKGSRILLILSVLTAIGLALTSDFRDSVLAFLRDVCQNYVYSYDLTLSQPLLDAPYYSCEGPLLVIHAMLAIACCYTIISGCTVSLAIVPSLVFFATCFLVVDTVPWLEFLFLWFFAVIMLLLSHPVRQRSPRDGNALARILALPVAAALAGLMLLVPPDTVDIPKVPDNSFETLWNWAMSKLPYVGKTAEGDVVVSFNETLSDRVSLDSLGPRIPKNLAVLEVTASYSDVLYLRARDFDQYTGLGWQSSPNRTETDFDLPASWADLQGTVSIRALGNRDFRYLPCYPQTVVTFEGGYAPNPDYATEYSYTSVTLPENWQELYRWIILRDTAPVDPRYLSLPDQTMADAQAILSQLDLSQDRNILTQVHQIYTYVRGTARYDLHTPAIPEEEEDFALWFLTQAESGYCVHYATAATVLLRAAGIPARYVEGYRVQTKADKTVVVRDNRAHAWVEYFVNGVGWLMLDPTPGYSTGDTPITTSQTTTPSTSTSSSTTTVPSTSTNPTTQTATVPTSISQTTTQPTTAVQSTDPSAPVWIWKLLNVAIGAGIAFLAFLAQYHLRRRIILRKMHRGKTNTQAIARYREAKRLSKLSATPIPAHLTQLAEKACFSQHKLTQEDLAKFDAFTVDCVAAMQEMPLPRRLYLRYIRAAY